MKLSIIVIASAVIAANATSTRTLKKAKKDSNASVLPSEVCTPLDSSVSCVHPLCESYVPGSCYEIAELSQSLIPDMQACYGETYGELYNVALLWNQRSDRGIPAIAYAESVGTIEAKHMQMDIALMFDHWDIIADKIEEILAINPNDPHALFAKAMYGFENVLPGVSREDIPAVIDQLTSVAPATAKVVDRALADVKMVWEHEFLHPFTAFPKEICGVGMNSTVLSELFPGFECEFIPEVYNPKDLAILVFGAGGGNVLEVRIETARLLAEAYPEAVILATGGALDTDRAEGDLILEAMPEYADRIVVDRQARDTIGNSLAIANYLEENDIGNLLIVTSTWHLPRSAGALRGVLQRRGMHPKTYLVGAGNNVQAPYGEWSQENADWLEIAYGGTGRFRAIEIPMTNRDFARGAGLFTMCDFAMLEMGNGVGSGGTKKAKKTKKNKMMRRK